MAIRYEDRIFLTGTTGSGKSSLARWLFLRVPGRRLILDPVGSDLTAIPGAVTFSDPRRATNDRGENWREATYARFVPRDPDDIEAASAVYDYAMRTPPIYLWCDEAGFFLPHTGANKGGRRCIIGGRKLPVGHMACHTRPKFVDVDLIAQAQHVMVFLTPRRDDRKYLADNMGIELADFEWAHSQLAPHGWLWWDQRERRLTIMDPLPRP